MKAVRVSPPPLKKEQVVNLGHPDDGGNETTSALKWLELGGDGIDTAYVYRNQQVGSGWVTVSTPSRRAQVAGLSTLYSCTHYARTSPPTREGSHWLGLAPRLRDWAAALVRRGAAKQSPLDALNRSA